MWYNAINGTSALDGTSGWDLIHIVCMYYVYVYILTLIILMVPLVMKVRPRAQPSCTAQ